MSREAAQIRVSTFLQEVQSLTALEAQDALRAGHAKAQSWAPVPLWNMRTGNSWDSMSEARK